jgi:dsRNA-specific ribonuclease
MKLGNDNNGHVKLLADIFEALVGAIYLDSKLDIELTNKVIMNQIRVDYIDKFSEKGNLYAKYYINVDKNYIYIFRIFE